MGITDRLRSYAAVDFYGGHPVQRELLSIADHIDAEHQKAIASVMNDALYHANDRDMADLGWYRALDADKKPMRLGDKAEGTNGTFTVHELKFTAGGCTTWDSEHGYTVHVDECRHGTVTVEEVLQQFLGECEHAFMLGYADVPQDIFDTYAAKLRLAGGDAE